MQAGLNAENSAVYNAQPTDPDAAEELPHENLSREQALELLEAVFEPELQTPAGIFDELEVERFVSNYAAVIAPGDQLEPTGPVIGGDPSETYEGATLLESTVPLRTEDSAGDESIVDLGLEHSEGELQPANPLVEVGIPQQLGEGVEIPSSGVKIKLEGAPADRVPSTVEDSVAVYPEVATDSSFAVAPTPSGLETMTLLQSADAPTSQTFHLVLPSGASLVSTTAGGAEVLKGGKPIMGVMPPSAVDANGKEVPVDLEVSGDSLSLHVSPSEGAVYPILVDPVYEDYNWLNNITGTTGWKKYSTTPNYYADDHATCTTYASPYACAAGLASNQKGMYLGLLPGSVPAGSAVGWDYFVPRWDIDWTNVGESPTSFITSLTFENFSMWQRTDTSSDPIMWTGIWNTQTPGWVSGYAKGGDTASWPYPGTKQTYPGNGSTEGKEAAFGIGNGNGHNLTAFRDAFLGRAIINLGDNAAPKLAPIPATAWLSASSGSFPIAYSVTDTGLGVTRVEATDPSGNVYKTPTGTTCAGTAPNPCPRTKTPSSEPGNKLEYDISKLPQGISQMVVRAQDPIGNTSAVTTAEVLVDRIGPSLSLSGTATEQAKAPNASEYKLTYSATDGDSAAPVALSQFSGAGTGEGKLERPLGVAVDKEGNVWVIDRTTPRVEEFNEGGQFLRQFGSSGSGNGQFMGPCGIAISPAGNIVVSDITNNNVQIFSPTGQFIRKITTTTDGAVFQDPYAIAPGSGEMALWISDVATHKVYGFSETGTLLKTLSQPMNYPSGLATDSAGTLWVSDTNENRIMKFSPAGAFLMQFGSMGTGNGQFVNPTSIAAAPSGNIMVSDATNNRLQEFQPNGVYLRQFGSAGTGLGQVTEERGLAFGPGNVLYVADAGNHRIGRWSHADRDNESGVASTEVKVDGNLVEPKYSPGCATENCSITKEWTLKSNAYNTGQHNVKVIATDGAGLSTTKELTITTDSTPPQLAANSKFFTAPEGWLEQRSYINGASASETGGSGVSSMSLKIDGKVVKSTEQSCPNKECSASIASTINMATYKGGAHPAELIATDVAGNTAKKAWTINVDPKGTITASEASATIEAVEETEPETSYIAPTDELISAEEMAGGNNPGLKQTGTQLASTGVPTDTLLSTNPSEGMTIEGSEDSIHIEPIGEVETAPSTVLKEEVAAVTSNTDPSVDTIVRPKYNGDMSFQLIRDATAPETYSWEIELGSRLTLGQIDSENIGVYHPDGSEAMLISAELAHDAVGKAVATTLTLEGSNTVTLTVKHRVAEVTYPVGSGASFELGYEKVETYLPPPPNSPLSSSYWEADTLVVNAPEATASSVDGTREEFVLVRCGFTASYVSGTGRPALPGGDCGNPFRGDHGEGLLWNAALRGAFFYKPGREVSQKGAVACDKWLGSTESIDFDWQLNEAYECHYGSKTSDGNGGASASAGHYLRAQAHWLLGHRGKCGDNCGTSNPWLWEDKAIELHLWPSGAVQKVVP
jgi:sugar lactone lactonase YvrE